MSMASIQATKEKYVAEILANDTYMSDAGMVQRLRATLLRLSKDDLGCLALVVRLKCTEAADKRHDLLTESMLTNVASRHPCD